MSNVDVRRSSDGHWLLCVDGEPVPGQLHCVSDRYADRAVVNVTIVTDPRYPESLRLVDAVVNGDDRR